MKQPVIDEAMRSAVKAVCERLGWWAGQVSLLDDSGMLVFGSIWHLPVVGDCDRLRDELTAIAARPGLHTQLPELVLERRSACWLGQLESQGELTTAEVRSSFALPVEVDGRIVAVLEVYSTEDVERDDEVLGLLADAATQLGIAVECNRLEHNLTGDLNAESRLFLDPMLEATGCMLRLIDDLLTFSRV